MIVRDLLAWKYARRHNQGCNWVDSTIPALIMVASNSLLSDRGTVRALPVGGTVPYQGRWRPSVIAFQARTVKKAPLKVPLGSPS